MYLELSMLEFMILLDTLGGTLQLVDGINLFKYSKSNREELWKNLHDRAGKISITTDKDKNNLKINGEK